EGVAVVTVAPESERQDGNVVNRARLDDRLGGTGGNQVEVRIEFVVELADRVFFFFTHLEAHDGHAEPRPRGRVDVLDAGDFPDELFHRSGDALLNFLRRRARHFHENVHHGNDNLRLFLAGSLEDGKRTQQNRKHHNERRQLGVDEVVGDAPGESELARAHRPSTRAPSRNRSICEVATFSPTVRPERISTRFPKLFPVFTSRYSTRPSGATTKIPCNSPWSITAELGTASCFVSPMGKLAWPYSPERHWQPRGRSIFTRNVWLATSAA